MNEFPEVLCWCLIATMATFMLWCAGRIFHRSFCSAQRLCPYDCNAPGRRKLVGALLGRKAGGAHLVRLSPSALAPEGYPTHFARNRIVSLWLKNETDTSGCLQKRAAATERNPQQNIERLSSSRAGFGPILSKNYVVTHGS
jgi:hypothetical protein